MTDYTKSTNFASKDSLVSGNPLKLVKGTEIDTEFNNIATAISTKADLASPTFTGVPAGPTAADGTATTQLATTAFAMKAAYPIGSIYMNASDSTNPGTLFGFGTWEALGEGRVLVGYKSGDVTFGTAGDTGGSADAIVVSHTHTQASHSHNVISSRNSSQVYAPQGGVVGGYSNSPTAGSSTDYNLITDSATPTINSTGSSATNANLQPYLVVYMWKRTA